MNFKKLILAALILLTIPAYATKEVGNGGDGIVIENKIYTYDFVEHGIHKKPYFNEIVAVPVTIKDAVDNNLFAFSETVRKKVAIKLAEVNEVDEVFTGALLVSLNSYAWNIIEDFSLEEINDEDGSDITIPRDLFRQVAVRNMRTIKFNGKFLANMDDDNIAGMILHEVIYAIIPLQDRIDEFGHNYSHQSSRRARDINSYLFQPALGKKGLNGLYSKVAELETYYNRFQFIKNIPISKYEGFKVKWSSENSFNFNFFLKLVEYGSSNYQGVAPSNNGLFEEIKNKACITLNGKYRWVLQLHQFSINPQHESYITEDGNDSELKIKWYLNLNMKASDVFEWTSVQRGIFGQYKTTENVENCLNTFNTVWSQYTTSK